MMKIRNADDSWNLGDPFEDMKQYYQSIDRYYHLLSFNILSFYSLNLFLDS